MTITLLTSTPEESLKIERQIIAADPNTEVNNPWHEDPVIYASRAMDPDDLIRRTIVRLISISDIVLNISGQEWIDSLCTIIGIPVYHELSEIMGSNPERDDVEERVPDPEPYEDEVWCSGCNFSSMNPKQVSDNGCIEIGCDCPFFSSFDDAVNDKNAFNIGLYDSTTMYSMPTKVVYEMRVRMAYGENQKPEDIA